MKLTVVDKSGQKIKEVSKPSVFDVEISDKALTLYINYLRAALRAPVANTKDRGEVSGGGRKPWKQKGTGNARVGSIRSPLWVGGGVTFGPTNERNFRLRINQTERKNAILGILNRAFGAKTATIIDELSFEQPKTSSAAGVLDSVKAEGKVSIIIGENDKNADLSFRNIAGVSIMSPNRLKMIDLLTSDSIVLTSGAIKKLAAIYEGKKTETKAQTSEESNE